MRTETETCPFCGANFQGESIPEEQQEMFGGSTHFSRLIGVSDWDSVYAWQCPDCKRVWDRDKYNKHPDELHEIEWSSCTNKHNYPNAPFNLIVKAVYSWNATPAMVAAGTAETTETASSATE